MTKRCVDKIHIRDLMARCIVGVYEEERHAKQDVLVNITLHADISKAGQTDCLDDTVDYKTIKKEVIRKVEDSSFFLVERLAEEIAQICLQPSRILQVDVTVDKPGALRFARSVAIEISRTRDENAE